MANIAKNTEIKNIDVLNFGAGECESYANLNTNFPLDAFPKEVTELLLLVHKTYNKSIEYSIAGLLATASTLIGNTTKGKIGSHETTANLYIAVIGETGTGKTPALNFWVDFLDQIDGRIFNKAKAEYQQADPKTRGLLQPPTTVTSDSTTEGLALAMENNRRGILWYADELSALIHGLDRYKSNKGADRSFLLNIWNGKQVTKTRATKSTILLPNPFLTVLGGIQPNYTNLLTDGSDGWAPRFLIFPDRLQQAEVFPTSTDVMENECKSKRDALLGKISQIVLFENPVIIKATIAAKELHANWYNEKWKEAINDSIKAPITAKMTNYNIRLAVILQALNYACGRGSINEISVDAVEGAIKMCDWFTENAVALFDAKEDPILKIKQGTIEDKVWQALSEHNDSFTTKQAVKFYVDATGAILTSSTEKTVIRALAQLVEKGVLKKIKHGVYVKQ
jgi:hypothetical protein